MKKKHSSLKKVILTVSMLAVFLVATVVSIVLVLAAQKGAVSTSIDIEYVVDGVTAQVSANYAIVPNDTSKEIVVKQMSTSSSQTEVIFEPLQEETSAKLLPTEEIVLNTKNTTIVFEYIFENLGDSAFSLQLVQTPEKENIKQTYYVSPTRLDTHLYRSIINTSEGNFHPQAVTEFGQKVYVYVKATIEKPNNMASYDGTFAWAMLNQDYVTVNLDNGTGIGGKSTLNVIKSTSVTNIDMPTIATLPAPSDISCVFDGYYSEENGGGTRFIDGDGTSANIATVTAGQTLYAKYLQSFNLDGTKIVSLTRDGGNLDYVVIPDGITEIGNGVFGDHSRASVVYIPASVETIDESAFEGNTSIRLVVFENGQTTTYADEKSQLTTIGASAFYGCSNLQTIVLPETLTTIGTNAFAECTSLSQIDFCAANMKALTTTTEVFKNAGKNGSGIVVNIGENVSKIPNYLFYCANAENAPKVREVNFAKNSSLTTIGDYSFGRLASLEEIRIPNGVAEIGQRAFDNCSGLDIVEFPASLETIGYHAFSGCSGVLEVYTPDLISWMNIAFKSQEATPVRSNTKLYVGGEVLTDLVIPSSVTKITASKFIRVSTITSLTIPEGVTSIGDSAFWACTGLTSIHIPASVTKIGPQAFRDCKISTVTFAENSQLESIDYMAFYSCQSLTSLTIPKSVTSIGYNMIAVCYSLATLVVEEGNTVYNSGSAYGDGRETNCIIELATNKLVRGCKGSTIPEGVEIIGERAFMYPGKFNTNFVIPSSVTTIEYQAFFYANQMSSLTIPSSVTKIGPETFKNCSALKSLTFESLNGWFVADSADATEGTEITISSTDLAANANLVKTTYASKWFIKSASLEPSPASYFVISEDGTTIIDLTLEGEAASEIVIPEGIITIGEGAFSLSINLISINIPSSVTSIGDTAFYYCGRLTSITIPSSVTSIGDSAFYACDRLTSITIPSSVTSIGMSAFYACSSLINLYIDSIEAWLNLDFGIGEDYKHPLEDAYMNSGGGSVNYYLNGVLITNLVIQNGVTKIPALAFMGCSSVTNITIPSSVTSIGEFAFYGCSGLIDIYYSGTEAQWNAIEGVTSAEIPSTCTIHYES